MKHTKKALVLYSIVFLAMGLAFWQRSLEWLNPVSLLILLLGTMWLWRAEGNSIYDLGLHRVASWRHNVYLGISIGLILPTALLIVQTVNGWITLAPSPWSATDLLRAVTRIAPIVAVEELVFRGYFLQQFSSPRGRAQAILLSSLLWSILHLPNMVSSGMLPTSVSMGIITFVVEGVALGLGFLRTGNTLWLPLSLHFGYSMSYSLLGILTTATYHAPTWLVGDPAWAPESGLLGLLLASAILMTVWFTTGLKGGDRSTDSATSAWSQGDEVTQG